MDAYCSAIRKLEGKFYGIEYHHMVCDQNQLAEQLSKLDSSRAKVPLGVFIHDLTTPSIEEKSEVEETPTTEQLALTISETSNDWREQFIRYLTSTDVPNDKADTE